MTVRKRARANTRAAHLEPRQHDLCGHGYVAVLRHVVHIQLPLLLAALALHPDGESGRFAAGVAADADALGLYVYRSAMNGTSGYRVGSSTVNCSKRMSITYSPNHTRKHLVY
jgi:hypothetical protein